MTDPDIPTQARKYLEAELRKEILKTDIGLNENARDIVRTLGMHERCWVIEWVFYLYMTNQGAPRRRSGGKYDAKIRAALDWLNIGGETS